MTRLRLRHTPVLLLLLSAAPALAATTRQPPAQPPTQEQPSLWQKTVNTTDNAIEWTKEKGKAAWEATKRGTDKGAGWVRSVTAPGKKKAQTPPPAENGTR